MAEQDGCLVPMIIQKSHNHQQLPLQCADLLLTLAQRSTGITGEDNYHLVIWHSHGKSQFLIGKPSINGPFSMAMLNNQMVRFSSTCLEKYPNYRGDNYWGRYPSLEKKGPNGLYLGYPVAGAARQTTGGFKSFLLFARGPRVGTVEFPKAKREWHQISSAMGVSSIQKRGSCIYRDGWESSSKIQAFGWLNWWSLF